MLYVGRERRAQGCAAGARTCGQDCVCRSNRAARASGENRARKERESREFDKLYCAQRSARLNRSYRQLQELFGRSEIWIQALPSKPFLDVQR